MNTFVLLWATRTKSSSPAMKISEFEDCPTISGVHKIAKDAVEIDSVCTLNIRQSDMHVAFVLFLTATPFMSILQRSLELQAMLRCQGKVDGGVLLQELGNAWCSTSKRLEFGRPTAQPTQSSLA